MKEALIACLVVAVSAACSEIPGGYGNGQPLKYISSCEIDLNGDNESDVALLVETVRGRELIVLLKTATGYNVSVLANDKPNMYLSCHFGKTITETVAGPGHKTSGKVYETPGAYIELFEPEGARVAFFWNGTGFQEVWTAD
jgi:hypothetical protein